MSYGWRDIDGRLVELCDECGFDARECGDEAAGLAAVYAALRQLVDHPEAERRPDEDTWSAREYADHCVDVTRALLEYVATARGTEPPGALTGLDAAATAAADVIRGLAPDDWKDQLTGVFPFAVSVEWIVRHLLHDLGHHVLDIRRGYARFAMADHREVHTVVR